MPLSSSMSRCALKHMRAIQIEAFARDDGLRDIDVHITQTRNAKLALGVHASGQPVHDVWLRHTIDIYPNIVDVEAISGAVPNPGYCNNTIDPIYKKQIGFNLLKSFRHNVKEHLAALQDRTHLTELSQVPPTPAIQAFACKVLDTRDGDHGDTQEKPFQLDHCHALRNDGVAVAQYYPRWVAKPKAVSESS